MERKERLERLLSARAASAHLAPLPQQLLRRQVRSDRTPHSTMPQCTRAHTAPVRCARVPCPRDLPRCRAATRGCLVAFGTFRVPRESRQAGRALHPRPQQRPRPRKTPRRAAESVKASGEAPLSSGTRQPCKRRAQQQAVVGRSSPLQERLPQGGAIE